MKKSINSKINIILFIIFISCNFTPKPKDIESTGILGKAVESSKNSNFENENFTENRLEKLIKGKVYANVFIGNVIYAKSGIPRPIRDKDNKIINKLKDKISYSYVFLPIKTVDDDKEKNLSTPWVFGYGYISASSVIIFETTKLGDNEYEVSDLKLVSAGVNINFEDYRTTLWGLEAISKVKEPLDSNHVKAYNFGTTNTELIKAFAFQFNNETKSWNYMLADLTLVNKLTNENETYRISLNPELFNDTIMLIKKEYNDALIEIPAPNAY